jgi:hypothetical protein
MRILNINRRYEFHILLIVSIAYSIVTPKVIWPLILIAIILIVMRLFNKRRKKLTDLSN